MAYTSEIEKLEQRYRENPKGRNFAPLADAYRKAGLLDNAIELCKSGLERHPDYVSAYIVYGRCLFDQKNDAAAADVLRKVIQLDPENVLALKMLAESAERGGRFREAVEWLTRLLAADPMNGDAAEALARAKGKTAQAATKVPESIVRKLAPPPAPSPPPPPPPPPPHPGLREATTAAMPKPEFVVERASQPPEAPEPAPTATPSSGIETFDGTIDFNAVAHQAALAEGIEVQEEVELKPQDIMVEGLAHTQYESAMFTAPEQRAPEAELDLPHVDLPLIMPDDVAEPTPPLTAQHAPAAPEDVGSATPGAPAVAGPGAAGGAPARPPAAVTLSDDDGAADAAALSRAEPVLTETMAELYLKQGHQEDALRVYHALLAQRPGDAHLRARVEALSPGGSRKRRRGTGESLQAFLKRILAGRPQAPEPLPPAAASSLESAFALASVEPEPEPEIVAPGEATRPAADTISLDEVFGHEGVRGSLPATQSPPPSPPPASAPVPPSGATVPSAPAPASGGFSFDQFFGAPAGPSAPAGGAATVAPGVQTPPRSSGPKARPPAEDEGDLDQFQAWLKGLKG